MTAQERQAAETLYRAIRNLPCGCVRQGPYSGETVKTCQRCAAMRQWEAVQLEQLA